ncbi:hypothetical protein HDA32_000381 [Spinactinospora alkalitolerans]|uniref:Integral membrane protein n=1 Tax=Spinactinospora alkalitolerans TaxID=687207 RepID=A0A852TP85_9ACTN|nr:hypothetical protein [Spinactinospora alkalitolerans]NYE45261.1 hypothetical protein [Spinactinospora alkalitolerans]
MHFPGRGPLWLIRTAVLAVACAGPAWAGHAAWAGSEPSPGSFLLAAVLMAFALSGFTRAQRGFGEIFAVLSSAQVGLHLLFEYSAPAHPAPPLAHLGHCVAGYSPGMLLGHLWAALLASALLSHGESVLWSLLGLLGHALPRPVRPPVLAVAGPVRRRTAPPPPTRSDRGGMRSHPTRGPPFVRPLAPT